MKTYILKVKDNHFILVKT